MKAVLAMVATLIVGLSSARAQQTQPASARAPLVEPYLDSGKLADGEAALKQHLEQAPSDDQARFGLGVLQVVRGVEHLMQNLHGYGLRSHAGEMSFLNLPVPPNPHPKLLTYEDAGKMVAEWNDDLATAEKTLAGIKSSDVKLPLHFGLIRLDFDGDGQASDNETLWKVYSQVNGQRLVTADQARGFIISFDAGDAQWLRGYCHLLMAANDIVLAYDEKELFDSTAHLFFPNPRTPYPFLNHSSPRFEMEGINWLDAIAFVHLLRCPVAHPQRMQEALGHLESVIQCSRESWQLILAETDDDHEWIPNPKQHPVILGWNVTQDIVDHWMKMLDETQNLLEGKKLAPFWRGGGNKGINVRKVFTDPRPLDLVLWVQGTAAAPYLERGPITDKNKWQDIWNALGQDSFFGFAIWFN